MQNSFVHYSCLLLNNLGVSPCKSLYTMYVHFIFISNLFPLINLEGPQLELPRLISWMKFETKEDYEKYFSRLKAFQTQVPCSYFEHVITVKTASLKT